MAWNRITAKRLGVAAAWVMAAVSGCTLLAPPDEDLLPPTGQPSAGGGSGGTGGVMGGSGGMPGGTGGMLGGTGGGGTGGVVNLCDNDRQDVGETGVDCGGDICPARCTAGGGCETEADCANPLACVGRVCADANCDDTVRNGLETGTDCGGPDCPDCPTGQGCVSAADCISTVCGSDDLCAAPTCDDDAKNGNETGIDCGGGGTCMQCPVGQGCMGDTDCQTQTCAPNLNPPTGACAAGATDCACTACTEKLSACNPSGPLDAPQCAEVLVCLLNSNCSSFMDCYNTNGSGACYDMITDRGGTASSTVIKAIDVFDNCIVPACPRTCQPLVQ